MFVMYYNIIYGVYMPSLLIESTDYDIIPALRNVWYNASGGVLNWNPPLVLIEELDNGNISIVLNQYWRAGS